jgi:hypothetical protein
VKGNCFLVVNEARQVFAAGEMADVLPRRGLF